MYSLTRNFVKILPKCWYKIVTIFCLFFKTCIINYMDRLITIHRFHHLQFFKHIWAWTFSDYLKVPKTKMEGVRRLRVKMFFTKYFLTYFYLFTIHCFIMRYFLINFCTVTLLFFSILYVFILNIFLISFCVDFFRRIIM